MPFQAMEQTPSTKEQLFGLFDQLEEALDARGYFHPAGKKPKMVDNLRAVLSRRAFTEQEISVLRGVISSLDRFSRKIPRGGRFPDRRPRKQPTMTAATNELKPVLVFDSGIGGLTVLREARVLMPERGFIYVADDAGFPYGGWEEQALKERIIGLFGQAARGPRSGSLHHRLQHRLHARRRRSARRLSRR